MVGHKTTLRLQRYTTTEDGMGGFEETWVNRGYFIGQLSNISGNEIVLSDKTTVRSTHRFYIDYPNGTLIPQEKDRFTLNSRTFDILYVGNPANKNQILQIDLKELS